MKLHSIFSQTAAALALSALLLSGCGSSRYHDPDLTAAFAAQETTQEEINTTIRAVQESVSYLRGMSPIWRDLESGVKHFVIA